MKSLQRFVQILAGAIGYLVAVEPASAHSLFAPSVLFVQTGTAHGTDALTAGLIWDWDARRTVGPGSLSGYLEVWLSNWRYEQPSVPGKNHLTQAGLTPVLRYRLNDGNSPWFMEAGVGVSLTSALYESRGKRFSTRFNFGTHLGVGYNFGTRYEHEIAVRLEHFSNAGIRHPNPGENFAQLRYSYRFR